MNLTFIPPLVGIHTYHQNKLSISHFRNPIPTQTPQRCRTIIRVSALENNENSQLENLQSNDPTKQVRTLITLTTTSPERAVELIQKSGVLESENQQVRLSALAALGRSGAKSQVSTLISILENNNDHSDRAAAANALGSLLEMGSLVQTKDKDDKLLNEGVEALLRAAKEDEHFIVRYAAIVAIGNARNTVAVPLLLSTAEDTTAPALEAAAAVDALGEMLDVPHVDEAVLKTVKTRALDREDLVRAAVARTLGGWREIPEAISSLEQMRKDEVKYGQSNLVQTILADLLGEYE